MFAGDHWVDNMNTMKRLRRKTQTHPLGGVFAYMTLSLLMLSIIPSGCTIYTQKDFIPVEIPRPVTLFDRYALRMIGCKQHIYNDLVLYIDYLDPVPDTTPLQSLPILVIDSLYFEGACMDSLVCCKPISHYDELYSMSNTTGIDIYFAAKDILRRDEQYIPDGGSIRQISWWPKACNNQNVFVTIHARLLDRSTGQIIAQESKRVEYFVKKKTNLGAGS